MIATITYPFALIVSALWFTAAFRYFSFQHMAFAKVVVPKTARHSPVFVTTGALARFLGGMNGAFALLSWLLVILWATGSPLFTDPMERGALLVVLAAAHFSQFIFNVPIHRNGGRQGESYWDVVTGPMLFIFVVDALETILNLVAGILQFTI